eukprot:GEMP01006145.1.p1 GENE.GEMP01006145.1~~GEMP01006145.1.p1  ORF type:complete len:982 (+),score=249.94 GEMP01006145.1:41-2986(+)
MLTSAGSVAKNPLRTSEDVIHRIKWDPDFDIDDIVLGYEDRLVGHMEMPCASFTPISQGGDLPYHRIWYVRERGPQDDSNAYGERSRILWDRARRIDLVFGSGEIPRLLHNGNTDAEEATRTRIKKAVQNMQRIAAEQAHLEEIAAEKARRKAAQSKRDTRKHGKQPRAALERTPCVEIEPLLPTQDAATKREHSSEFRVLTFNVLFDLYVPEQLYTEERMKLMFKVLRACDTDIICLQEVTPTFHAAILERSDFRASYYISCFDSKHVEPFGNLILSKFPITSALLIPISAKKTVVVAELATDKVFCCGRPIAVACIHLSADRPEKDNSEQRCEQAARVLEVLEAKFAHCEWIVCGDMNDWSDAKGESATFEELVDCWHACRDDDGHTFDPATNALAAITSSKNYSARLDRIYLESSTWRPTQCHLVAQKPFKGQRFVSDHAGLLCTFTMCTPLELCKNAPPTAYSSLCIMVPENALIKGIRTKYDPSFGRWPAHVNVLYGFVHRGMMEVAADVVDDIARTVEPFELEFSELSLLKHDKSVSVVSVPRDLSRLSALGRLCQVQFPHCGAKYVGAEGSTPHLTLAKFTVATYGADAFATAERFVQMWQTQWTPLRVRVDDLVILQRMKDEPFEEAIRVELGENREVGDFTRSIHSDIKSFIVGSCAFGISGKDVDIVCVGHLPADEFYTMAIRACPHWHRYIPTARVPVLQFTLHPMSTNNPSPLVHEMQYAYVPPPHALYAPLMHTNLSALAILDELSVKACTSILDIQRMEALLSQRNARDVFLEALTILRTWAQRRGIYGTAVGFLGGISYAVLCASALEDTCNKSDPPSAREVLSSVSRLASQWDHVGITLRGGNSDAAENAAVTIWTPSYPRINTAARVSKTTRAILNAELRNQSTFDTSCPHALPGVLHAYAHFFVISIHGHDVEGACGVVLGRACAVVNFLHREVGEDVRPYPLLRDGEGNNGHALLLIGVGGG